MNNARRFFENHLIKLISPPKASLAAGAVPATYIDVSRYPRFAFFIQVGAGNQAANELNFTVVQATAADGTGSKNVTDTDKSGTVLDTAAIGGVTGTSYANKWFGIEVETRKLDLNNGFRYVALETDQTAVPVVAIVFIAHQPDIYPVEQEADNTMGGVDLLKYFDG